jgi:hypothetical protein
LIEGQVSFIPPSAEASIFLIEGRRRKIRKQVTTKISVSKYIHLLIFCK